MVNGTLSHIDFSVSDLEKSILFYDTLLPALGYRRWRQSAWGLEYPDGSVFGIDLRPAETGIGRSYNRYEPGPHHLAFNVDADAAVDAIFERMREAGAEVADAPANYGGQPGYGSHYYAVFFFDPDGFKVEVVHSIGFEV